MPIQRPPTRPVVPQPIRYSTSNPPTSSFPNQQRPQQVQVQQAVQQRQPLLRPLPAPLPSSKLPPAPTPSSSSRPLPTPGKRTTIDSNLNSSSQIASSPGKRTTSDSPLNSSSQISSLPGKRTTSDSPLNPSSQITSLPGKRTTSDSSLNPSSQIASSPGKRTTSDSSLNSSSQITSSSPPKPSTIVPASGSTSKPIPTDGQPPKKPAPVWKRTIPEIPAPVWGYAAGLVADPHPKLSKPPPLRPSQVQVHTGAPVPESPTKSTGVPNKLKKKVKTKEKEKDGTKDDAKKVNNKTKDQISAVYGNAYGLGYSSRQAQEQRYSAYQYGAQQGQYSSSRISGDRLREEEQEDEDEETTDGETVATEEEETEEGEEEEEEETGEEEDVSDSVPSLRKFGHGNRHYSQPLVNERSAGASRAGVHRREEEYHGSGYDYEEEEEEEDEDTPKKRNLTPGGSKLPPRVVEKKILLRPKVKVDPYDGYEDVTPIGQSARKPIRPRSEIGGGRMFGEMDIMSGTPRNGRIYRRSEDESDGFVRKGKGNERPLQQRPRSAIEEREMLILNARARNRNRIRGVESDYGAEEIRLAYDDDGDDYEGEATVNDSRGKRGQKELTYRPQSQPNSSSRLVSGGRAAAAGLPRPPAMIRDRDGGGFIRHNQVERKIQGGPRSAFVQVMSDGEAEGNHDEERGVRSWPGDLPRLPRTPGEGGDTRRGYFDSSRSDSDLNLDEPPPPASIVRTPSPGVAGGYVLQKRAESQNRIQSAGFEQTQHRRIETLDNVHQRTQGQGRVYASKLGYPPQSDPQSQVPQQRRQQTYGPVHPGRYTATPSPRKQQQTPAPPRPMGIESPYPVGGRDRMADMNKLERGERDAEEENGHLQGRRIADVRNVPKVMVMDDNDGVVTPKRIPPTMTGPVGSDRRPLPLPSSPQTRPNSRLQSMVMAHSFGGSPKKTSPAQAAPVVANARDRQAPRSSTVDFNSNATANNNDVPAIQVFDVPGVYISKPGFDDDCDGGVMINISGPEDDRQDQNQRRSVKPPPTSHPNPSHSQHTATPSVHAAHGTPAGVGNNGRGLVCGGCHGHITNGRILSAMGLRWHPPCFKCTVCNTLLEHVSSYENEGKAYCHLDYHEVCAILLKNTPFYFLFVDFRT